MQILLRIMNKYSLTFLGLNNIFTHKRGDENVFIFRIGKSFWYKLLFVLRY